MYREGKQSWVTHKRKNYYEALYNLRPSYAEVHRATSSGYSNYIRFGYPGKLVVLYISVE